MNLLCLYLLFSEKNYEDINTLNVKGKGVKIYFNNFYKLNVNVWLFQNSIPSFPKLSKILKVRLKCCL